MKRELIISSENINSHKRYLLDSNHNEGCSSWKNRPGCMSWLQEEELFEAKENALNKAFKPAKFSKFCILILLLS